MFWVTFKAECGFSPPLMSSSKPKLSEVIFKPPKELLFVVLEEAFDSLASLMAWFFFFLIAASCYYFLCRRIAWVALALMKRQ